MAHKWDSEDGINVYIVILNKTMILVESLCKCLHE